MADGRDQTRPPGSGSTSGPPGTPIGSALTLQRLDPDPRGLSDRVARAVAAIDRVHGDGSLPTIPLEWARLGAGDEAEIVMPRFGRLLVPQRIIVDPAVRRPGLAILHEIGHFLDAQTLGERGEFASASHPNLAGWRHIIAGTRGRRGIASAPRCEPKPGAIGASRLSAQTG